MLFLTLMNLGFAEGLPRLAHQLGYLTGNPLPGYCETYDGGFLDARVRDVIAGDPNIVSTDTPTMRVSVKMDPSDATTYTVDGMPDSFSQRVTWDPPPSGRFVRMRVTSSAATALNGATIFTETGGEV